MALGIPLPGSFGEALNQGVNTGSSMFARIMEPILKREQLAQQMKIHKDALALQQASAGRAAALAPLHQQLAQLQIQKAQMESDPTKKLAYIQTILQGLHGGQSLPNAEPMSPMSGSGMPNLEEIGSPPVKAPSPQQLQQGGFNFTPEEQMALNMAGIKLPQIRETPQQKRFADLESKLKLEEAKTANKAKVIQDKEKISAKKDIPVLENSLKGVDELINIAKNNPEMFGKTFLPELYAKTTKNKNFGVWQNLIADRIAGLEMKLSSRGNIVALKLAQALKPSHAESQQVAIGKLESMKKELLSSIERSKVLAGHDTSYKDTDLVIVEGPNGEETMTYAQARQLGAQ
ncbi:hypothetical protein [Pedobacter sp.]|jgi:hypothetical protein|uniref:hypothetical protein n=1 Tax=Pedobacter sp. TaxID=1411316 RepID=UPI002C8CF578|nr:hypothetical protein [Pedobacter sp.]HWW39676.1 hypothetical protein [Pedobacter sp.]